MDTLAFDPLGPRGRRWARIGGAVTVAAIAGVALIAVNRLADTGHLAGDRWRFLADGYNLISLANGLIATLRAGLVAGGLAFVLGLLILAAGRSRRRSVRGAALVSVHILRGFPLLLLIYFSARFFDTYQLAVSPIVVLVSGLIGYHGALISEVLRGGIDSVDRGQTEAGVAVGVSPRTVFWRIVFPQAFRRMVPALLNELVVLIKHSSLGYVIPYADLLRQGKFLTAAEPQSVLQVFLVVAVIYLTVNFTLTSLASWLERRLDGRAATAARASHTPVEAAHSRV
ncbi:amino acid ABC transporter permease [Actinomadura sp. KC06]|uniref:amino acid ABC transporter permease n=1 Tax=Actinomadura sp. KC06 TaxID=2530369 RepID=UPI0010453536|nr:amino acid ABC transporter permease [Actinomadura sp. KC06]TDD32731.1 amino acid ABC transporter permease [Actinomadura sp. KC06]